MNTDRYEGKPLKRLLECYVLWAVGKISPSDEALMEDMAPKLRQLYGADGTWQEVIAAALHFPPAMPEAIREQWRRNLTIAQENGVELEPQHFAEMLVDANFV